MIHRILPCPTALSLRYFLVGLMFLLTAASSPWPAAQANAPEAPAVPSLTPQMAIDLSRAPWVVIDSDVESPSMLPVQLPAAGSFNRQATISGSAGWLVTEFTIPALPRDPAVADRQRLYWGSLLTIGALTGREQVYVNETLIGEGPSGLVARPLPRRYVVPATAWKFGQTNRLSLRIRPLGGSNTIGFARPPVTLAHLGPWHLRQQLHASENAIGRYYRALYAARAQGIHQQAAFALVARNLSEIEPMYSSALRAMSEERKELSSILSDLDDLLSESEGRRSQLEMQAYLRRRGQSRQLASQLAQRLGVPVGEVRLRPESYGRFGFRHGDGLPGLREISPLSASAVATQGFEIRLGGIERIDVMETSWANKVTRVAAQVDRDPSAGQQPRAEEMLTVFYMHASSLFPGGMIESVMGRRLSLQLPAALRDVSVFQFAVLGPEFRDSVLLRSYGGQETALSPEARRERRDLLRQLEGQPVVTLVVPRRSDASPMLLIHENPVILNLRRVLDRPDLCVLDITTNAPVLGRTVFMFPSGSSTVDASREENEDPERLPQRVYGSNVASFLAALYQFGARFPVGVDEVYHVNRASGTVQVLNRFIYSTLQRDLEGFFPAMIPPQVQMAQQGGYPIGVGEGFRLRLSVPAPEGPLFLGSTPDGLLSYSMPIPAPYERLLPAEKDHDLMEFLHGLVEAMEETPAGDSQALDALHRGRTSLYEAWPALEPAARARLTQEREAAVNQAFAPSKFQRDREPFTEISTAWESARIGPGYALHDQEMANALLLHAFHQMVRVSGDWALAQRHGEFLRDTLWRRLTAADDWAWMRAGSAEHGGGTALANTGNALMLGARAWARLSEGLGRREDADQGWYMAARAATSMMARFRMTDYAMANQLIREDSVVLGWQEGDGFVSTRLAGYPWPLLSIIDADGVAPPVYDHLTQYARPGLEELLRTVRRLWPRWYDGRAIYSGPTPWGGNTGRVTLPMIYLLARLDDRALLADYLREAAANPRDWWTGPVVLAEAMTGDRGVWLEDWATLQIQEFLIEGDRVTLRLMAGRGHAHDATLRLRLPNAPSAVWFSGGAAEASARHDASASVAIVRLKGLRPSLLELTVDLTPQTPPPGRRLIGGVLAEEQARAEEQRRREAAAAAAREVATPPVATAESAEAAPVPVVPVAPVATPGLVIELDGAMPASPDAPAAEDVTPPSVASPAQPPLDEPAEGESESQEADTEPTHADAYPEAETSGATEAPGEPAPSDDPLSGLVELQP